MLKGHDILVLSDDWGRHQFSCQHIVERLLPFNRVLWVNTIGFRTIKLNRYDIRRALEKMQSWIRAKPARGNTVNPISNLHIINPVCLPFGGRKAVRLFNDLSVRHSIREQTLHLGIKNSILITTLPTAAGVTGTLGECLSVYYCVDDTSLWPGNDGDLMRWL
ncbi:MAG: glycosyltransferase family 1 protein, partial [Chitinivibrionales bacterium]|nr:glycosyltransferase family 1 protein [Chitinivibrionales bacterium]MBD3356781.1 glycosyltransferase family 1 protein [Chitinivibrionales bacterium]